MKRGRPTLLDSNVLEEILIEFKDKLYNEETNKITSKLHPVWNDVSEKVLEATGTKKSAVALHTHVTCRRVFTKTKPDTNMDNVSKPRNEFCTKRQ